jgi:hypothetical protein
MLFPEGHYMDIYNGMLILDPSHLVCKDTDYSSLGTEGELTRLAQQHILVTQAEMCAAHDKCVARAVSHDTLPSIWRAVSAAVMCTYTRLLCEVDSRCFCLLTVVALTSTFEEVLVASCPHTGSHLFDWLSCPAYRIHHSAVVLLHLRLDAFGLHPWRSKTHILWCR